jgi:hypothetical protein
MLHQCDIIMICAVCNVYSIVSDKRDLRVGGLSLDPLYGPTYQVHVPAL